eukprot:jgi/Mesvir1/16158/Mv08428-RA.1
MLKATKPKTAAGRRALKKREPKREETFKRLLLLHGTSTSQVVKNALTDMYHLTRPGGLAVRFTRKNADILPFEPGKELSLEFLAEKSDCGLFLYGSHSKKRPHNLILGRMYDAHILDMVELELASFLPIQHFGAAGSHAQEGSKPCIVFQGEDFETKTEFRLLKSLLVDTLRGLVVKAVNLAGVDRVYVCSAVNGQVMLRHYVIRLKKSGTKIPRVELEEMGPRMDLRVRRTREAPPDLRKEAYRTAAMETKKKVKNTGNDMLDGKVGRIYMPKQDLNNVALMKMKGVRRERQAQAAERKASKRKPAANEASEDAAGAAVESGGAKSRKKQRS